MQLKGEYTADALNKIYSKYNFPGLPALRYNTGIIPSPEVMQRNRGLGEAYNYIPGTTFFPSYGLQKLKGMSLDEAIKTKFKKGGYGVGDEVDEHMVEELRRQGYTVEEI